MEEIKEDISIERIERLLGDYNVENSIIKLRPYQQTALDKVNEIFETERFSSVILPTGGGKSFVALAELIRQQKQNEELIRQGKEPKKMLYLAPQNEILEQIKDDIVKYIHGKKETIGKTKEEIVKEVFPTLEFSTYSSLIARKGNKIVKDKYGFIVLDELHRTGAKEWGDKLNQLLDNQDKDLRVLGITATPRRDADGKDMSIEIAERLGYTNQEAVSGKHIAMNMSLTNAIRMGLVVNPKLVSCEYNLANDGTLDKLRENIENIEDVEKRNEKVKEYEELRKNLEFAKGIPDILRENIRPGGRYFVFLPITDQIEDEDGNQIGKLKGKGKIKEYKNQLMEYFKGSDIKPSFYSMLGEYGDKENKKRLEEFQSENGQDYGEDTKFMLVINKANEGLHLEKLDGMIWLRPMDENSRIVYLQQLGRVIYSENPDKPTKDENRPVVIDLVNNTLKVNWNNEANTQDDIEILTLIINWTNNHDGILPNINSSDKEERGYAKVLIEIQEKYKRYTKEGLEGLEKEQIEEVKTVLRMGENIDLWQIDLPRRTIQRNALGNDENRGLVLGSFEVNGLLKDFVELTKDVEGREKLTTYSEVLEFCKEKGRVPKQTYKRIEEQTIEERKENSLYKRWLICAEKKIIDSYSGKQMEEIPKGHKALVEQMRKYGYGIAPIEEILEFCREKGRVPRKIYKKAADQTKVEKREQSLYDKWRKSTEKKIIDSYVGKQIEEIPEEHRRIVNQMREYGYGIGSGLTPFEEVFEFCQEKGRLPTKIHKKVASQTKEEQREQSLYAKWRRSNEKKIVDSYVGKQIEEVPEVHRNIVNQMRKYGYGIESGLTPFEEILEFCKEKGRMPTNIYKKAADQTKEEKRENSLYGKWIRSEEKKILDNYVGKQIEEIPEEYKDLVNQMREYGYGIGSGLTPFEEILEFCKENIRVPAQIKKRAGDQTVEEKEEQHLYERWRRSKEKKIIDSYEGKSIEEIPEEYRNIVEQMREYEYGIGSGLTPFEEILEFCKEKERMPANIRKKAKEMQGPEKREKSLYKKWLICAEKKIVDKYIGKQIGEIPEKYRDLVEQMRSYGYGIGSGLTSYEEILEFCKENGRVPKRIRKKATDQTKEEKREQSLYHKWLTSSEKKIIDGYTGEQIEEIPEEHRNLVKQMREYGYLGNRKKYTGKDLVKVGLESSTKLCDKAQEQLNKAIEISKNKEKGKE